MLPIVTPEIEKYLESLQPPRDDVLREMEAIAEQNDFPIIGPDVGLLLYILTKITGAKRVLELGSGYGYSAYWFAQALPDDGLVVATDTDPGNKTQAEEYFARSGLSGKLQFELGEALDVIDRLDGEFDIIFNDIDKEDYPLSTDKIVPKLKMGGLFITDNSLWYGKIVRDPPPDETTARVVQFNRELAADPRFEMLVLPIRDGLTIARKK